MSFNTVSNFNRVSLKPSFETPVYRGEQKSVPNINVYGSDSIKVRPGYNQVFQRPFSGISRIDPGTITPVTPINPISPEIPPQDPPPYQEPSFFNKPGVRMAGMMLGSGIVFGGIGAAIGAAAGSMGIGIAIGAGIGLIAPIAMIAYALHKM